MKKDNHIQQVPDPEKFWPEAEKLLDKHFLHERRKKIFAFAFIASLVLVGSAFFLISNNAKIPGTETNDLAIPEKSISEARKKDNANENNKEELAILQTNSVVSEEKLSVETTVSDKHPARVNEQQEKGVPASNKISSALAEIKHEANSRKENASSINLEKNHSQLSNEKTSEIQSDNFSYFIDHSDESYIQDHDVSDHGTSKNEIQYMAGIHKANLTPFETKLHSEEPFALTGLSKKSITKGLSFGIYALMLSVSKDVKADGNVEYVSRREKEEKNILAHGFGINVSMSRNNFSYGTGIEYSYFGEKNSYDAYSRQTQYIQSGSWQTYTHVVTDIDTAYISGLQWFLETQVSQLDSTYETRIDTNYINKYDPSISDRNSVNKIQYIEIPLMLSYRIPINKFDIGISVGISPVWIFSQRGHYLKQDLGGVESIRETKPFNSFLINGRLGLDVSYHLSPRIRIFVSPAWKTNLSSITKSNQGFSQKYSALGLQLGAAYNIY